MAQAYAGVAHLEAIEDALTAAGERIRASMPDPDEWGRVGRQAAAAAKAEAMFGPG